jgi:hypothetical protein
MRLLEVPAPHLALEPITFVFFENKKQITLQFFMELCA